MSQGPTAPHALRNSIAFALVPQVAICFLAGFILDEGTCAGWAGCAFAFYWACFLGALVVRLVRHNLIFTWTDYGLVRYGYLALLVATPFLDLLVGSLKQ